jgi:hypothetical protein
VRIIDNDGEEEPRQPPRRLRDRMRALTARDAVRALTAIGQLAALAVTVVRCVCS